MEKVSNCCEATVTIDGMEDSGICSECGEHCEYVCADCGGTGEVTTMESVYNEPGSPSAPIGTAKCHCQIREDDGDGNDN